MKKLLNLKNMKETIVNYSGDQKEFDKIWDAFYQMACIGFIDSDLWKKFNDQCRGWYVDEENACVRNGCISISIFKEEKKMKESRTKKAVIADIIQYFKEDEDLFNDCMEELDWYNGYLGDDRYYNMEELNDLYSGQEPQEILFRAFYGFDADSWHTDSSGNKEYRAFNPNREYFYFNGYGNLVSSDYKDYSDKLDGYAIEAMSEDRSYINSIENDDTLADLFDELEEAEEE